MSELPSRPPAIIAGLSARDLEALALAKAVDAEPPPALPCRKLVEIRRLGSWTAIRMRCECGCGGVVRSALASTVLAAVQQIRFDRKRAQLAAEAFMGG